MLACVKPWAPPSAPKDGERKLQLAIYSMMSSLLDPIWLTGDKAKDE